MSRRFLLSGLNICHRETRIEVQSLDQFGPLLSLLWSCFDLLRLLITFYWFSCSPDNRQSTSTNTLRIRFVTDAKTEGCCCFFFFNCKLSYKYRALDLCQETSARPVEKQHLQHFVCWQNKAFIDEAVPKSVCVRQEATGIVVLILTSTGTAVTASVRHPCCALVTYKSTVPFFFCYLYFVLFPHQCIVVYEAFISYRKWGKKGGNKRKKHAKRRNVKKVGGKFQINWNS